MQLERYQQEFIDFLVESKALTFGDFVTKSGRHTPYFINTGQFNDGERIRALGIFYARHIMNSLPNDFDILFGPAYKGIPLAVATSYALMQEYGHNIGYCFDRKERKNHGDGGDLVGSTITNSSRVAIIEDVITAGTTLQSVVPFIKNTLRATLQHVVIAVDRKERGNGARSAVEELEESLQIRIHPIVNIPQIIEYLSNQNSSKLQLSADLLERITAYRKEYGV
ncbi:MAG: orotate phosphoribosyltransferase [Bdellovibrionales bacterium]|nr:orotate phosphoribosyltransferase [Bdellovibrionales bacterium]